MRTCFPDVLEFLCSFLYMLSRNLNSLSIPICIYSSSCIGLNCFFCLCMFSIFVHVSVQVTVWFAYMFMSLSFIFLIFFP